MLLTMSRDARTAGGPTALRELGFDKRESNMEHRRKDNAILVVASLLSILLLTLHITDDIVRGISKAEPSNTALLVLAVLLYGTLVLAERPSGHVIMLLVGLFAAGMPVIHMRGAHYGEIAKSAGGFLFVWTLWALGGLGGSPSSSRCADSGICDGASAGRHVRTFLVSPPSRFALSRERSTHCS
jgi:hypothetical protein